MDNLVGLDGLCQYASHDEGSEGRAEAYLGGQYGHEAAQTEGDDEQRLLIHQLACLTQDGGDEENAHDEP